jgi:hypothetical protein
MEFIKINYYESNSQKFYEIYVNPAEIESIEPIHHTEKINAEVTLRSGTTFRTSLFTEIILGLIGE